MILNNVAFNNVINEAELHILNLTNVSYAGAESRGVWFDCFNRLPKGSKRNGARILFSESFEVLEIKPIRYCVSVQNRERIFSCSVELFPAGRKITEIKKEIV